MSILNKYLLKNIISGYLFILLIFIGLYFIVDLFSNLSDILKTKPPVSVLVIYYVSMTPLIFLRVSPFSLLVSVLYTFGELNRGNEIISMRSCGISVFKISLPVLFLSLFVSIFSLYIQENTLAISQKKVEDIKIKYIEKQTNLGVEEKNLAFSSENMIFFAQRFRPMEGSLQGVTIFQENSEGNIIKKTISQDIHFEHGKWIADDLLEYLLDENGNIVNRPSLQQKQEIPLTETPKELALKKSLFSQFASFKTLKKEIDRLKKISADKILLGITIDYHRKISEPLSHFFIIICVLPFALEIKKRKAVLSSLGTGFIFGLIYYTFVSLSMALGKAGTILPVFGAWLAPLFFLTVGITGLLLVK